MPHPSKTARRRRASVDLSLLALGIALVAPCAADAPSGGAYQMKKQVIAAGGGHASGGSYALVATVGQSVAGQTDGDGAVVQQGFHASAAPRPDALFGNSFE